MTVVDPTLFNEVPTREDTAGPATAPGPLPPIGDGVCGRIEGGQFPEDSGLKVLHERMDMGKGKHGGEEYPVTAVKRSKQKSRTLEREGKGVRMER